MAKHRYHIYLVLIAAAVLLLLTVGFTGRAKPDPSSVDEGAMARLKSEAERDPSDFKPRETTAPEVAAADDKEEAPDDADDKPAEPRFVILIGDSRVETIKDCLLWPPDQTFSFYDQVEMHYEDLEKAAGLQPDVVIFMNGLDDVAVHESADIALKNYEKYIDTFHELSPDTEIYVHKVLDVTEEACVRLPGLREIPKFNRRLRSLSKDKGWNFIDCSAGYSTDLLISDGVHFTENWAVPWMEQIRKRVGF